MQETANCTEPKEQRLYRKMNYDTASLYDCIALSEQHTKYGEFILFRNSLG